MIALRSVYHGYDRAWFVSGVTNWNNVTRMSANLGKLTVTDSFILSVDFICRSVGIVTRPREGWSLIRIPVGIN